MAHPQKAKDFIPPIKQRDKKIEEHNKNIVKLEKKVPDIKEDIAKRETKIQKTKELATKEILRTITNGITSEEHSDFAAKMLINTLDIKDIATDLKGVKSRHSDSLPALDNK